MNADDRVYLDMMFAHIKESNSELKVQYGKIEQTMKDISDRTLALEQKELLHASVCPLNTELKNKIERVDKDLEDIRVFKKYPKLTLAAVMVLCVSMFLSSMAAIETFKERVLQNIEVALEPLATK